MIRRVLWTVFLAAPGGLSAQFLVVANMNSSTASIIDARPGASGAVVATLPTGITPHEVAVSSDGKWAVITNYGNGSVVGSTLTVIDLPTNKVARTISVAPHQRPHGAAFLPDNKTLVVTSEREGGVLLVDVVSGSVTSTLPTGSRLGHMVVLSPDARTGYVANVSGGALSVVDLTGTEQPVVIPVGPQTEGIGISPDGRTVWMGSNSTGKVFVVDVGTQKVIDSVTTGSQPYRVGFTPDGKTALVTNPLSDELRLIDAGTRKVRSTIKIAAPGGGASQPQGIAVSKDGRTAWITLGQGGAVAEVDIGSAVVTRYFTTEAGPDGIAVVYR